jgi:hypothetical protein
MGTSRPHTGGAELLHESRRDTNRATAAPARRLAVTGTADLAVPKTPPPPVAENPRLCGWGVGLFVQATARHYCLMSDAARLRPKSLTVKPRLRPQRQPQSPSAPRSLAQ